MKKKTAILFVALALVFGAAVGAMAASGNETISALLNREITILYNGTKQTFADANGNAVYPITYNGTTYLPVRSVSNLVGLPVNWNQAANTVELGSTEKQPASLVKQTNFGATEYNWIITDADQLKFSGDSGIQEFQSGVAFKVWNGNSSAVAAKWCALYFDVAGYSELTFQFAKDVANGQLIIYDQDGNVLSSADYSGGIVTKTISLNGATKISLQANGKTATYGNAYFFNPTLK